MTWSAPQRRVFVMTGSKAGWNDAQRYAVMRYAGCPSVRVRGEDRPRPTVSAPGNTITHFRECMAVAESACRMAGVPVRPPREHPSWDAACHDHRGREEQFARRVAAEAERRLPRVFARGLLDRAVAHVAKATDNPLLPGVKPDRLEQCDGPTVHRVAECLRAWVGRTFAEHHITPDTFDIPTSARRRAASTVGRASSPSSDPPPSPTGEMPERSAGGGGPNESTRRSA